MKRQPQTQACPVCGSVMVYERRDDLIEYRGHQRTIKTLGFWCNHCGEGILTGKPLLASEKAYIAFKAEIDELEKHANTEAEASLRTRQSPVRRRTSVFEQFETVADQAAKNLAILAPDEITSVRKKLRLSRKRASELLGGEDDAFSEYESGNVPISVPMSNLLRLLDNDPKRLHELTGPTLVKAPRTGLPSKTPVGNPRRTVVVSQSDGSANRAHQIQGRTGRSRSTARSTGTDS